MALGFNDSVTSVTGFEGFAFRTTVAGTFDLGTLSGAVFSARCLLTGGGDIGRVTDEDVELIFFAS